MRKVLRVLKFSSVAILFKIKLWFTKRTEKCLFIIRTDEIGDYILFRNFLQEIRNTEKFKNYKITLIGNKVWRGLAEFLDQQFVDEFIWIDVNDLWGTQFFKTIFGNFKSRSIDFLIAPQPARNWTADRISMMVPAKNKIVAESTLENTSASTKKIADFFYTGKILIPENVENEFAKNKFFFEQVCLEKISIETPFIDAANWSTRCEETNKYIVIVVGAGSLKRAWPADNFAEIVKFLLEFPDIDVILTGGKGEDGIGNKILKDVMNARVENLIGKTSLPDLAKIIAGSLGVISNETGAAHMAAALNINTIVLLGGGHFGRFMPYLNAQNTVECVYHEMECFKCGWNCIYNTEKEEAYPCIKNINTEEVKEAITNHIMRASNIKVPTCTQTKTS